MQRKNLHPFNKMKKNTSVSNFKKARSAYQKGNFQSSIGFFAAHLQDIEEEAISSDKKIKKGTTLFARGTVYQAMNMDERAIEDYKEALKQNVHTAEIRINLGAAYSKLNMHSEAIENYSLANTVQLNAAAYNNMGISYEQTKQYSFALWCYNQAIAKALENSEKNLVPDILLNRANFHRKLNHFSEAFTDYEDAVKYYKEQYSSNYQKLLDLLKDNELNIAIENGVDAKLSYQEKNKLYRLIEQHALTNKKLFILASLIAKAHYCQGITYYAISNLDKAIENYTCAITHYEIAEGYAKKITYEASASFDDGDRQELIDIAYYKRGLAYKEKGENEKAKPDFIKAKRPLSDNKDVSEDAIRIKKLSYMR